MVPGTVRNVTHKSFSIFECICETKRKHESENEKEEISRNVVSAVSFNNRLKRGCTGRVHEMSM